MGYNPRTNIAPANIVSQKESSFPTIIFQAVLVSGRVPIYSIYNYIFRVRPSWISSELDFFHQLKTERSCFVSSAFLDVGYIFMSWASCGMKIPILPTTLWWTNTAGWNITIFNRKYIDSIQVHFPASYVSLPEGTNYNRPNPWDDFGSWCC